MVPKTIELLKRNLQPSTIIELSIIFFLVGLIVWSGNIHPVRVVMTTSMIPTLQPGDVVIIKKTDNIKVGDIIVYHSVVYDEDIVHRVIAVDDVMINGKLTKCYVTKGDNNQVPDYFPVMTDFGPRICVPQNYVKGKVVAVIPKIGKPIQVLYMKFIYKEEN